MVRNFINMLNRQSDSPAIGSQVYSVGTPHVKHNLICNTYLLVTPLHNAVLIDPGPASSFPDVLKNIQNLIDPQQVKFILLHDPEPDNCSSLASFEQIMPNAVIITSERTMLLAQYYNLRLPFQLISDLSMRLEVDSQCSLQFVATPYLHFPGAFVTYEPHNGALFSSDLFSSFSPPDSAGDSPAPNQLERMLAYHELMMPSNSILRPVIELLSRLNLRHIYPQHGSPLTKHIAIYLDALRELQCGNLLTTLKQDLLQSGGLVLIFNELQHHLLTNFQYSDVTQLFQQMPFLTINQHNEVTHVNIEPDQTIFDVWNAAFRVIREQKGIVWITTLEPFVRRVSLVYELPHPDVLQHTVRDIYSENQKLIELNRSLDQTIHTVNDRLLKCPITGLYNETFLRSLLFEELTTEDWRDIGDIVIISIDDFSDYLGKYGSSKEELSLNNMAYILQRSFGPNSVYRINMAAFALYLKNLTPTEVIRLLDKVRVEIKNSDLFVGKLTISAGVAFANELMLDAASLDFTVNQYIDIAAKRLRTARTNGKDRVCSKGEDSTPSTINRKVLIADTDTTNISLIRSFLAEDAIEVIATDNGVDALRLAGEHHPAVIIADIMLNRMDGFTLREKLNSNSETKTIETIYLSFKKDDASVARALKLGVTHYLRKPYLLTELLGIVKKTIQGVAE